MRGLFPRVRSNSLSTLAVAAPASTSRPVLSSSPRLPSEAPKQSQHSQLALSQPTPGLHPPLFPCGTPPLAQAFIVPTQRPSSVSKKSLDPRPHKRQRLNYQLDVAAYGIPKHRASHPRSFHSTSSHPHTSLSVQVGEDAYFIRDNAMGIADGVGGWARSAPPHTQQQHPTPSALFSRRLMHFCSAELETHSSLLLADPHSNASHLPTASFSFSHHLKPPVPYADLEDALDASLDDLADGIDVLNILERAYDSTVRTHTAPSAPATPLTTGSSTALLAVLDHPPIAPLDLHQSPEAPHRNYARGSLYTPDVQISRPDPADHAAPYDAVLRIAHLGDCMGMLVRGDAIAWRTDEMWWGYNYPLQLGPPVIPSTPPSITTSAHQLPVKPHTFTLPVRADDILILASDGLSDNLWDEDVLDEVVRLRKGLMESNTATVDAHPTPPSTQTQLRRKAFAGMLSEALCSRAKRVSETRPAKASSSSSSTSGRASERRSSASTTTSARRSSPLMNPIAEEDLFSSASSSSATTSATNEHDTANAQPPATHVEGAEEEIAVEAGEVPFARRAKLAGRAFRGGKCDDISVIVAVIAPSVPPASNSSPRRTDTTPATSSSSFAAGAEDASHAGSARADALGGQRPPQTRRWTRTRDSWAEARL